MRKTHCAFLVAIVAGCAQIVGLGPDRELESSSAGGSGGAGGDVGEGAGGSGGCPQGPLLWVKQIGDASQQIARDVAADADGGVWTAGMFQGAIDLGGASLASAGDSDMFIARFDRYGAHLASARFGDDAPQPGAMRLAATSDGGVVLAGSLHGTVDLGDGDHVSDLADAFVARYDAAGKHVWSHEYGGMEDQKTLAVAVDPRNGDIVIGGHYNKVINLGGEIYTTQDSDGFVAKFNEHGVLAWSIPISAPGIQYVNAVAIDDGNIVVGGSTDEPIDLGFGAEGTGNGDWDAFVAVYNGDGMPQFADVYADGGHQTIQRVAIGPQNHIVVAGEFAGTLHLGPEHELASGQSFLAILDSSLTALSSRAFDGIWSTPSLAVDANGNVLFASRFAVTTNVGAGPINALGNEDGLMTKFDDSLEHVWTQTVASLENDNVPSIAADAEGNVYSLAHFRDIVFLPGCGEFTSAGRDSDLLLIKHAP